METESQIIDVGHEIRVEASSTAAMVRRCLEAGSPQALVGMLTTAVETEARHRFYLAKECANAADMGGEERARYDRAVLDLHVWVQRIRECTQNGTCGALQAAMEQRIANSSS